MNAAGERQARSRGGELRERGAPLHGIQSWFALPKAHEETEPTFHHHPARSLPEIEKPGVQLRLIAGRAFGAESPAQTFAPMFYLDAQISSGAILPLLVRRVRPHDRLPVVTPGASAAQRGDGGGAHERRRVSPTRTLMIHDGCDVGVVQDFAG